MLRTLNYYNPVTLELEPETTICDICIYGATSGGVIAAVQARRYGYSVALLAFNSRLGGMTSSGLGATDIGNKETIGGLAREFYEKIGSQYGVKECWKFEPHVAEAVFTALLSEAGVTPIYEQHLAGVAKANGEITEIWMDDGRRYRARVFVDASYEGDLLARAGVSYHVGREDNSVFNETYNGVQFGSPNHNFKRFVDPYKISGDSNSGLLRGISNANLAIQGSGDKSIQAYNFRLCLTKNENNIQCFTEPNGYDPEDYTLLSRYLATGVWDVMIRSTALPGGKTDTNNHGGFSSDFIGGNHEWPEADYSTRNLIYQEHVRYTKGLFWFLANDKSVPQKVRDEVRQWGTTRDEFPESGGWSPELYIRESRRMVSAHVMTEHHAIGGVRVDDSICMASYALDSHNCQRVVKGARVVNEGNVEINGFGPYGISYKSIIPAECECTNLLVPFCLSASHIAFGSIRMEPVFMMISQSAIAAAHLCISKNTPLQRLEYDDLRRELWLIGQVLEAQLMVQ